MEKLIYVVWKRAGDSDESFKRRLLDEIAPTLLKVPVEKLRVCVTDDDTAAGTPIGTMDPPKSGIVSFWMEQSQNCGQVEAVLAPACGRIEGYLVVESRPLVNTEQVTPSGQRTPGFSQVTCVLKRADLSHEQYLRVWYDEHRACGIETQSTFGYVRNEIVRALTENAPVWTAIVEENFPIGALTDPAVFYDAVGDPDKLRANQKRMMETCEKFIDLSAIEAHHCSEYDL